MTTFFITDEFMLKHKCEWDHSHIEKPERLKWMLDKLRKTDLLDKCKRLESRVASMDELELVHTKEYIERIKSTQNMSLEEQEQCCSNYEDIYVNKYSWESALLAAGSALLLTESVLKSKGSNGFAAIRPPGHHASADKACGFCLFNNIAICAKHALSLGVKRVLIVDWDVHAGQGTQYSIKDDDNIKLVSIHRFEEGRFWPQLAESSILNDYSNTLNVPLNSIKMEDRDYLYIMCSLILPLIESWKPELILVSCGFDAAFGDPEGEMEVSPQGFGMMTGLLAMQEIPLVLLLEGGYFLESIGECAETVLKALLDRVPPKMFLENVGPSPHLMDSVTNCLQAYRSILDFDLVECINLMRKIEKIELVPKFTKDEYKGNRELSFPYPTRGQYTPRDTDVEEELRKRLHELIIERTEHTKEELTMKFEKSKKVLELTISGKMHSLHFEKFVDIFCFYHLILLPLTFKYEFKPALGNFTSFSSSIPVVTDELISETPIVDILSFLKTVDFDE